MPYDFKTARFHKESQWKPEYNKSLSRDENGIMYMSLYVNKEQWDILRSNGPFKDIFPNQEKLAQEILQWHICDVILMKKYE